MRTSLEQSFYPRTLHLRRLPRYQKSVRAVQHLKNKRKQFLSVNIILFKKKKGKEKNNKKRKRKEKITERVLEKRNRIKQEYQAAFSSGFVELSGVDFELGATFSTVVFRFGMYLQQRL